MTYNLDDSANQAEYFEFLLGGNTYKFRYPTTEEIEELQSLTDSDGKPDSKAVADKMYSYIEPAQEGTPSIQDALKPVRVPVLKAFNRMISEEFGLNV